MALSTMNFYHCPISPQIPKFCITNTSFVCLKHTVPVIIDAHVLQTFSYTKWVRGVACQKQLWDQTWQGLGQGAPKSFDPLLISAAIEATHFSVGIQWVWGVAYQETTFRTNIGGGLG